MHFLSECHKPSEGVYHLILINSLQSLLDTLAEPYDKIISSHPCVQGANRESDARAVNRLNWRCQLFHMLYWPKYVNAWGSICGNLQACRLNTGIALLTLKGISSLSSFSFTSFNFPTPPPLCVLDALSNAPLLDSAPPPPCACLRSFNLWCAGIWSFHSWAGVMLPLIAVLCKWWTGAYVVAVCRHPPQLPHSFLCSFLLHSDTCVWLLSPVSHDRTLTSSSHWTTVLPLTLIPSICVFRHQPKTQRSYRWWNGLSLRTSITTGEMN